MKNRRKKYIHFQTAAAAAASANSLPPSCSCVFHSSHYALPPPSSPAPPPPLCPCWIGGVNTGREQALFHHAGQRRGQGWAFLRSSCAGVKSLLWFSFHLSSANGGATLTRLNSDPCKEFHSKDGLTPVSQPRTPPPPRPQPPPVRLPFSLFQAASFTC